MATLPPIIGLPPLFDDNIGNINEKMIDSMPIATITPSYPQFKAGMSTMIISKTKGMGKYKEILRKHGYSLSNPKNGLKVAFLADSFPTDSFSNSYTEGFLQDFSNGLSKKASTLIQTFGGDTGLDAFAQITKAMSKESADLGSFGKLASGVLGQASSFAGGLDKKIKNRQMSDNNTVNSIAGNLNAIAAGARVDFPQIWSDSQFTPSYTMTVRLYNPDPSNLESTRKFIIGPVAALMLLGIPISADGNSSTYNYPFLHDINAPGIYHLNPCYISNIAIIKGGDQQQIAYNQAMGIVDVRLDFGSLYSSILASNDDEIKDRPTLASYLKSFEEGKILKYKNPKSSSGKSEEEEEESEDSGYDIPDPTGKDGEPRDPDPYLTKKMFSDAVKKAGSLSQAIKNGLAIPESMAKELFKDGLIKLQDLLASFPDISLEGLEKYIKSLPPDFITNLTDEQLKYISGNMLQNIIDSSSYLNLPQVDVFGMNQNILNNISSIADINNLSVDNIIKNQQSFFSSLTSSIANGAKFTFNGVKNLFSSAGSIASKLGMGTNDVLRMGDSLFANLSHNIGGVLTNNQLIRSAGSMLGSIGNRMTPTEGFSLLKNLQSTIGDFSLTSGIDLVNKVKAVAEGDIFASLDLVENVKKLAKGMGIEDNAMLSSSIGIFDGLQNTVNETGILDNLVVAGGIELFKNNYQYYDSYDLSLRSSSSLLQSMAHIADDLNLDGSDVITTGFSTFNNLSEIQNTLQWTDSNILETSSNILESVSNISHDLGISEEETVRSGKNTLDNMSKITNDVETMMYIIKS